MTEQARPADWKNYDDVAEGIAAEPCRSRPGQRVLAGGSEVDGAAHAEILVVTPMLMQQ